MKFILNPARRFEKKLADISEDTLSREYPEDALHLTTGDVSVLTPLDDNSDDPDVLSEVLSNEH